MVYRIHAKMSFTVVESACSEVQPTDVDAWWRAEGNDPLSFTTLCGYHLKVFARLVYEDIRLNNTCTVNFAYGSILDGADFV